MLFPDAPVAAVHGTTVVLQPLVAGDAAGGERGRDRHSRGGLDSAATQLERGATATHLEQAAAPACCGAFAVLPAELAAAAATRQAASGGANAVADVVEAGEHVVAHHGAPEGRPGAARESTNVVPPLLLFRTFGLLHTSQQASTGRQRCNRCSAIHRIYLQGKGLWFIGSSGVQR